MEDHSSCPFANAAPAFARHPPRPTHAEDTRHIRDVYRLQILSLLYRAGWAHRHECALLTVAQLPLSAATRRAQRMLAGAITDGLVLRRYLPSGDCIYGLTAAGARWLSDAAAIEAHATTTALSEASRVGHRRIATQIAISGEHLGCHTVHERELYKRAADWRDHYAKIPDVILTWQNGSTTELAWHEVDRSHRSQRDIATLQDTFRILATTRGRLRGALHVQLVVFVFHVRRGPAERQLRRELARLWALERWGASDLDNGMLSAPGFTVLLEPMPPVDYWPVRDGFLLPWRPGLVPLPREEEWSDAYQQRGPVAVVRNRGQG